MLSNSVSIRKVTRSPVKASPKNPVNQPSSEFWSEVKLTGKNILPRSYHSAVVRDNQLFIYGGYEVHQGILSDFYMLDFNNIRQMKWVELCSNSSYYPGPRWRHTCVKVESHIYLFGGQITSTQSTQNINSYNIETKEWDLVAYDRNQFPSVIDSHNALVYDSNMIVYGGYLGGDIGMYSSHVYCFNFQNKKWKFLSKQCEVVPEPRASAGTCIQDHTLYMFGGSDGVKKYNDLWLFDLKRCSWRTQQINYQVQDTTPQSRHGLSLNMYDGCIYMFGGIRDVTREKNDLHIFDTSVQKWASVSQTTVQDFSIMITDEKLISLPLLSQITRRDNTSFTTDHKKSKKSSYSVYCPQNKPQMSPLMTKITKAYEEKMQYQRFFAMNQSLANQQKRRQQLLKKSQFLKDLDIKTEREKELLRMITPISGALRHKLNFIGNQEKNYEYAIKHASSSRVMIDSVMLQTRIIKGKYPCARDGHSSNQISITNIYGIQEDIIVLFGGDRHLMSFNDIYLFDIQNSNVQLKQPLVL